MSRRRVLLPPAAATALLAVLALAADACRTGAGQRVSPDGETSATSNGAVVIDTGARKVTFHVELARTPEERERGLMYRDRLAPDRGMLFLFDRPSPLVFWMKNTAIPLDMIFMDGSRRIVGVVANAEPHTLSPRRVDEPSQYVLEIAGGLAATLGIHAGQAVEFRDVRANATP